MIYSFPVFLTFLSCQTLPASRVSLAYLRFCSVPSGFKYLDKYLGDFITFDFIEKDAKRKGNKDWNCCKTFCSTFMFPIHHGYNTHFVLAGQTLNASCTHCGGNTDLFV